MTETPQEEPQYQTYMWVVAHPDDLEFGSGGTVARFAKEGKKVILIQVTSGDRGTTDRSFTPRCSGIPGKQKSGRQASGWESARSSSFASPMARSFLIRGSASGSRR